MDDLHRRRRRCRGRQTFRFDIPDPRVIGDVRFVIPVSKRDQLSIRAALAGVLRAWLAVHLKNRGARFADQAADKMKIIDLDRGRGRLHRLVNALQDRGNQRRRSAKDFRRFSQKLDRNVR